MKTLIVTLLACSMCLTGRAQEQFTEPFELLSAKGHDTDFTMTECAVVIGVIAAGASVVIWLRCFCEKRFGTNQPASTNTHKIQRSENLADWKLAGAMSWQDETKTWEYKETNTAGSTYFYRITNYFGQ